MFKIHFFGTLEPLDCRFKTESKVLQKVKGQCTTGHFHKLEEAG